MVMANLWMKHDLTREYNGKPQLRGNLLACSAAFAALQALVSSGADRGGLRKGYSGLSSNV
ncbi:MAG: hypothetical protein B6D76_14220 [gamma proteobacterium symbiont of Stewartia floridana]|nr:MAG: hypothetical protein B6D76_14220 [gamma proteobacterium symbiont of Stewartia floridana]RLW58164.1 MAG: hypothetical protein B6D75_14740 [gamma proteobacterium symbiont of Stewartia floridana]